MADMMQNCRYCRYYRYCRYCRYYRYCQSTGHFEGTRLHVAVHTWACLQSHSSVPCAWRGRVTASAAAPPAAAAGPQQHRRVRAGGHEVQDRALRLPVRCKRHLSVQQHNGEHHQDQVDQDDAQHRIRVRVGSVGRCGDVSRAWQPRVAKGKWMRQTPSTLFLGGLQRRQRQPQTPTWRQGAAMVNMSTPGLVARSILEMSFA